MKVEIKGKPMRLGK